MGDWRPIETAPKDGTEILIWTGHQMFVAWHDGSQYWVSNACIDNYYGTETATHWMPLPEPPAAPSGTTQ